MDVHGSVIKYVTYPLWLMKNNKYRVLSYLKEYESKQYDAISTIREEQLISLKKMVCHAYDTCSFYRDRMDQHGIKPKDIHDFSDYLKIPMLTKQDIQENLQALTSTKYVQQELVANRTGGSTGSPLRYYHDRERTLTLQATAMLHFRWAGLEIGDKMGIIWGNRRDMSTANSIKAKIRDYFTVRSKILDSSSITEESLRAFAEELRIFKPKVIQAYANSMYLFAEYCRQMNIRDIRPFSIVTSAEVLHPHERKLIEEVFECKVFDFYGCREVSTIASECEKHTGLHLNATTLYVEFVNDAGQLVENGCQGNIVITDLLNYGMPFIRYKIEDIGALTNTTCSCGRGLPLMEMIAGRTTDFIKTPDGRKVSGSALTIYLIAAVPGIRQAQIVQDQVDHLIFNVAADPEFKISGLNILKDKVAELFGKSMRYDIQYVNNVPKEASGKYRFSISKI